ncbi:hypothetical protein [Maricaulis sp.]|uniref:hypothetical protein n=1 Tax=Maricaulis sp. TaxID=1486257 RepID=UPI003A9391A6
MGSHAFIKCGPLTLGQWAAPTHELAFQYFPLRNVRRGTRPAKPVAPWQTIADIESFLEIHVSAEGFRRRLDLLGFTLTICCDMLEAALYDELQFARALELYSPPPDLEPDEIIRRIISGAATLSARAPETPKWLPLPDMLAEAAEMSDAAQRVATDALTNCDEEVLLRLAAEGLHDEIILDLSGVYQSGLVSEEEIENFEQKGEHLYLILTEGSSDRNILRTGLDRCHPELSDLFYFADEKLSIPHTGASRLTELVKAFVSLKILNRTIVLFDNDAEGAAEHAISLEVSTRSGNISPIILPELPIFDQITCLGPNGSHITSVNRRAAPIEMYLDRCVIDKAANEVEWSTYLHKAKRWQGNPIAKKELQAYFFRNIDNPSYDISALLQIFETIFEAASEIGGNVALENYTLEPVED